MKTLKLEIKIDDIEVEDGYYTICYSYRFDGKKWKEGEYNSDFDGWTDKEWKKELGQGEALRRVLQEIAEDF
jgi:hypothetical protein